MRSRLRARARIKPALIRPPSESELWLIVGESYARGAATDPQNNPAGFPGGDGLFEVTITPSFEKLSEPTGIWPGGSTAISPGSAFVWRRKQANARPQILANTGRGGTTTAQWRLRSQGGVGWLEVAISQANWAIAKAGVTLKGVIGLWGVNDAIDGLTAYATNVAAIETAWRAQITGAATVPFVVTRLQPWAAGMAAWTTQARWDAVRDLVPTYVLGGANRYMADIPTGTMTSDGLHPQAQLNLAIGENIRDVLAPVVP